MRRCPLIRSFDRQCYHKTKQQSINQSVNRVVNRKFTQYGHMLYINDVLSPSTNVRNSSYANHTKYYESDSQYEEEVYGNEDLVPFESTYQNQPLDQPVNQPVNQSVDQLAGRPIDQVEETADSSIGLSSDVHVHQSLVPLSDEKMAELSESIIEAMNNALEQGDFSALTAQLNIISQQLQLQQFNPDSIFMHLTTYSKSIDPSQQDTSKSVSQSINQSDDIGRRILRVLHLVVHSFKPSTANWSSQSFESLLYVANRIKSSDHVRWLFNQLINSSHRPASRHWSWLLHTYQISKSLPKSDSSIDQSNSKSVHTIMQSINSWNSMCIASHRIIVDSSARSVCFDASLSSGLLEVATDFIYDLLSSQSFNQSNQLSSQLTWGEQAKIIEIFARQSQWEQVVAMWQAMSQKASYSHQSISQSIYQTLNEPITLKLAYHVVLAFDRLGYHSHVIGLYEWLMTSAASRCIGSVWHWGPTFINLLITNLIKCDRVEQVCLVGDVLCGRLSPEHFSFADDVNSESTNESVSQRDIQLRRLALDKDLYEKQLECKNPSVEPVNQPISQSVNRPIMTSINGSTEQITQPINQSITQPIMTSINGETFDMLASVYNRHCLYSHTLSMYRLIGHALNDPSHELLMRNWFYHHVMTPSIHNSMTSHGYTLVIHALVKFDRYDELEKLIIEMEQRNVDVTPDMLAELVKGLPVIKIPKGTDPTDVQWLRESSPELVSLHKQVWRVYKSNLANQPGEKLIHTLLKLWTRPDLIADIKAWKQRQMNAQIATTSPESTSSSSPTSPSFAPLID